ncbi:DDT domain-containing protein PTM [Ziziphus jujuba]|uniref:DDT domain-containing protein PTM n=1 Tax=Ziziphus jujuba TaxID=326968 RepID=A0A6P3Z6Z3_ZIZJJ|nr:DDT domain-containing protein PTM [Ziziphus jujuba]
MEAPVVRSRGRPRKRRINEDANGADGGKAGPEAKKRVVEMVPISLLNRFVLKEFKSNGIFIGKVVYYADGFYRVVYEDGDYEDLDSREVKGILLGENYFDDDLRSRSKKLEDLVMRISVNGSQNKVLESTKEVNGVESSTLSELSGGPTVENDEAHGEYDDDDDADSSGDSCEYARDEDLGFEAEAPSIPPPPQLPPSSGTIGVPEEYVSHLFSVYGFLRSFSICLFLSPFTLDDFVGSLNCRAPNTLLDAIHVALLRSLRRHLETLSSDGFELASNCLRCTDWSLLDTLTWPVYLIQYLTVMGYTKGPQWKGFYDEVLDKEYYLLSTARKLIILQLLCDDVLDSAELRAEIDMREESEVGIDYDAEASNASENGPRRVHPRYSKTSACKDREALEIIADKHERKSTKGDIDSTNMDVDRNSDECRLCAMDGTLLCCDGCPSAYHTRCIGVMKMSIPEGSWYCPECTINKIGPTITIGTSLKGAEIFSIDSYGQIFVGTCDHLLVLKGSTIAEPCLRYYNQNDIPKVLQVLCSTSQHADLYFEVCQAILRHWDIPGSVLSLPDMTESDKKSAVIKEDANFPALSLPSLNPGSPSNGDTKQQQCMLNMKLPEGNMSTSSASQQADRAASSHRSYVNMSSAVGITAYTSNGNNSCIGHANVKRYPVTLSSLGKEANHVTSGKGDSTSLGDFVYMGSLYKPQAYLNHYMHGDFAASAAAKLAVLLSEETRPSEAHASDNHRKVTSTNNLQAKAFSLTASRFFWPSSEKKLIEVPRERCGWCLSCKAAVSSKRGCMLNHAALSATKGAMRILANLRPIKSGEGSVASIAMYILYMEESLCGLVIGPFLSANYRKEWRKRVEQASTISDVKALLLELEENIRTIAVSGDWTKLVDDWLVESSVMQSATCAVGTTQKRAPNGRRNRKQSAICEVTADGRADKSFVWWQGGKQTKLIFQKAILPHIMVKRAARQGGWRKIAGLYYTDGSEIPKRSRQLVWRAAVEMSKNASQLSLQVRYLDFHVRWGDLVRPEQNLSDAKSLETEASAFRNASICYKKIVENKIIYGIAFGSQKHLPSRVMKNIIEIEQDQDGKDKFWFPETRIPLYLIKEYEGGLSKAVFPSMNEPSNLFLKLQKKRLKGRHKDTFFYLQCKRDNMDMHSCCSCQMVVIHRHAVTCYACQGFSHRDCAISSAISTNEEVEFVILCKRCYNAKALAQNEIRNESPTTPLNLPMQEYRNLVTVTKGSISNHRAQDTHETKQITSDPSLSTKSRRRTCSWGIIWKKKNSKDTGTNFRQNNILLSGGANVHRLEPVCHLCRKPYRSDLMYVCCETCKNWYHAEAVELAESQIFDVVGFKCCRCRRIRSPVCPYKATEDKKSCITLLKQESYVADSDFGTIFDSKKCELITPIVPMEDVSKQNGDPLLFPLSRVELVTEPNSEVDIELDTADPAPRKLPIRRHMKREEDFDTFSGSNVSSADLSANNDSENPLKPAEDVLTANLQWDASVDGLESGVMLDDENLEYENDEFEPQTLFTFSELLGVDASEDGFFEQYNIGTCNVQSEPIMSEETAVDMAKCQMCALEKPAPDLFCENCGLWTHSQCLPPIEQSSWDGSWKCNNCREWR